MLTSPSDNVHAHVGAACWTTRVRALGQRHARVGATYRTVRGRAPGRHPLAMVLAFQVLLVFIPSHTHPACAEDVVREVLHARRHKNTLALTDPPEAEMAARDETVVV